MRTTIPSTCGVLVPLAMAAAGALTAAGGQSTKLLADDGKGYDYFGASVAVSGTTVLVGSPFSDSHGPSSGAAYLFDTTTGRLIAKYSPGDAGQEQMFGDSVAISGGYALVGAAGDDENGVKSGAVYVFDMATGEQLAKLLPGDGEKDDRFGAALAVSGDTAIIGAYGKNSAYLFDITTGEQITKLVAEGASGPSEFGFSVSISADTAIVGARYADAWVGAAYIFDVPTGEQRGKLSAWNGSDSDRFGHSVAISGDLAVVGAPAFDVPGLDSSGYPVHNTGAAYLFDLTTGHLLGWFYPEDSQVNAEVGTSVAISGTIVAVGGIHHDLSYSMYNCGGVWVFDANTGQELDLLVPTANAGWFGSAVAISGTTVVVGAKIHDDEDGHPTGATYVFEEVGGISMLGATPAISLGEGGTQDLALDAGAERAGELYLLLGSLSGTSPGIGLNAGAVLPLEFDAYTSLTLSSPGLSLTGALGTLDAQGAAAAAFHLPPGTDVACPALLGTTVHHAFVTLPGLDFASNAVACELIP